MPYIGQPLNAGNLSVDVFTGNGSTTVFALTYSVGSSESVAIYLDGVKQAVSTYTASGTVLTFTTAPPNGVGIEVVFLALSISLPTPGDGTVDETKLKDALVADFTEVVVTASDSILLGDATDSGNTKRDTVQGILDLVPGAVTSAVVSTTYDLTTASGTQDVTGFGFDPSVVFGMWLVNQTDDWGFGFTDFTLHRGMRTDSTTTAQLEGAGVFPAMQTTGAGVSQTSVPSSITDGVRFTWTKTGSPTGSIFIYLIGIL